MVKITQLLSPEGHNVIVNKIQLLSIKNASSVNQDQSFYHTRTTTVSLILSSLKGEHFFRRGTVFFATIINFDYVK